MQSTIHSHCLPSAPAPRRITLLTLLTLARSRRALARLDEARLHDLGLTRHEAEIEAKRPLWDVPVNWHR